ncbi:MAG: glycosyltransferase family 4 protein [bacterium]|nr:glycosyltransferase family 4 protein [bacterium]
MKYHTYTTTNIRDLFVLYIAPNESKRDWTVNYNEIEFRYSVMSKKNIDEASSLFLIKKTWEKLNEINPDIVICSEYSNISYWVALFWVKLKKKKAVVCCETTIDDKKRYFLKEMVKSIFVRNCNFGYAAGTKSLYYLEKLGLSKSKTAITGCVTNNNFYTDSHMKYLKKRKSIINHFKLPDKNFIFVGRFSAEKNIFTLLDAFNKSRNDNKWGLVLTGDGPLREEVKNYIKNNNIKNVLCTGFIQKEEIGKFYAVCNTLILPSCYEPWGLVVNEAMACSMPVIVSRKCGCYPDIVKDNINGFGFDPENTEELTGLLNRFINNQNDEVKMGMESKKIIDRFSLKSAVDIMIESFNQI